MSERCENCRFWIQAPPPSGTTEDARPDDGHCRRYPTYVPRTSMAWCGEWRRKVWEDRQ